MEGPPSNSIHQALSGLLVTKAATLAEQQDDLWDETQCAQGWKVMAGGKVTISPLEESADGVRNTESRVKKSQKWTKMVTEALSIRRSDLVHYCKFLAYAVFVRNTTNVLSVTSLLKHEGQHNSLREEWRRSGNR